MYIMSSRDALGIPNPILNETWLPDLRRCLYKKTWHKTCQRYKLNETYLFAFPFFCQKWS